MMAPAGGADRAIMAAFLATVATMVADASPALSARMRSMNTPS
jgi:hypothetical protein